MNLSVDLIDQFVDVTNDDKKVSSESTVYGTVVKNGDKTYVRIDGSTVDTPVDTKINVKNGDRVAVLIKNHTATITSNLDLSAVTAQEAGMAGASVISSFGTATGDKLSVNELDAKTVFVDFLVGDKIVAENINAAIGNFSKLQAGEITVEDIVAEHAGIDQLDASLANLSHANIVKAIIEDLEAVNIFARSVSADYADFKRMRVDTAEIKDLVAKNIEASIIDSTAINAKFATLDFANIGEAAIDKFYAISGIINKVEGESGIFTKELVGVTIDGDLINAGTLRADRLILKDDETGLYYQLNVNALGAEVENLSDEEQEKLKKGIHGSNIIAKTIAAEHIAVSDLTAFKAKIAGLTIDPSEVDGEGNVTPGKLYSGAKSSVDSIAPGIYQDSIGQFAIGNSSNYLKFYKYVDEDDTEKWKLAIHAEDIFFGSGDKTVEDAVDEAVNDVVSNIKIGTRNLLIGTSDGYGWLHHGINLEPYALTIQNGETSFLSDSLQTCSVYPPMSDGTLKFDDSLGKFDGTALVLSNESKTMSIYNRDLPISLDEGQTYTISFYAKRDNNIRSVDLRIVDTDEAHAENTILQEIDILQGMDVSDYSRFTYTFTPASDHNNSVLVKFELHDDGTGEPTTLTVKEIKLEHGVVATDWTQAPEDNDRAIQNAIDSATAAASSVDTRLEAFMSSQGDQNKLFASKTEVDRETGAIRDQMTEITQTHKGLDIRIQSVENKKVDEITTSTGYTFDANGLTIDKSGTDLKTQMTENGMKIVSHSYETIRFEKGMSVTKGQYYSDGPDAYECIRSGIVADITDVAYFTKVSKDVLTANDQGVDAKNLHATTYLIVGNNSRFEDYGNDRTACFFIGG